MLWNLDATLATTFKANGPSTPEVAVTGGSDARKALCRLHAHFRRVFYRYRLQLERGVYGCDRFSRRPLVLAICAKVENPEIEGPSDSANAGANSWL
jgi:hypothetical protein